MGEAVDVIQGGEHVGVVDLHRDAVKEIGEAQLPGVGQHGVKLYGEHVRVRELGVRDDADIRVLLHEQQQVPEGQGGISAQDGGIDEFLPGGDPGPADALLPVGVPPVVAQHHLAVPGQAQIRLKHPHPRLVLGEKALQTVEGVQIPHRPHAVGDYRGVGEDVRGGQGPLRGLLLLHRRGLLGGLLVPGGLLIPAVGGLEGEADRGPLRRGGGRRRGKRQSPKCAESQQRGLGCL